MDESYIDFSSVVCSVTQVEPQMRTKGNLSDAHMQRRVSEIAWFHFLKIRTMQIILFAVHFCCPGESHGESGRSSQDTEEFGQQEGLPILGAFALRSEIQQCKKLLDFGELEVCVLEVKIKDR